jgi:hypothetical protein
MPNAPKARPRPNLLIAILLAEPAILNDRARRSDRSTIAARV